MSICSWLFGESESYLERQERFRSGVQKMNDDTNRSEEVYRQFEADKRVKDRDTLYSLMDQMNSDALAKVMTYKPSIVTEWGATKEFITSIDGKKYTIPISFISDISAQVKGPYQVSYSYGRSHGYVTNGMSDITITMISGVKHTIPIVYTCTDILLDALKTLWKNN